MNMAESPENLYFYDCSGSTGGQRSYWNLVRTVASKAPSGSKHFLWDTFCRPSSKIAVLNRAQSCKGGGGTSPACFVPYVTPDSNVTIITDGQISQDSVKQADSLLGDMALKDVKVLFQKTSFYYEMNTSVALPFIRNCNKFGLVLDGDEVVNGSSKGKVELDKYFGEPQKFIAEAKEIRSKIVAKVLGSSDRALRDKLLHLQKNLLSVLSKQQSDGLDFSSLRKALDENRIEDAYEKTKEITRGADTSQATEIESLIRDLTKICEGTSNFSFAQFGNRVTRAAAVTEASLADAEEEVEQVQVGEKTFECPISLDEDSPVLLIANGTPVFDDIDKGLLNTVMSFPLITLQIPELIEKIKSRIDKTIGLEAAHRMFEQAPFRSPLTRREISSAISFGIDESHVRSNNFGLADLFFGNKLVGSNIMWYAVVYFVCRRIPYLAEDEVFLRTFEKAIVQRMRAAKTYMTLSGLPIDPMIKAPYDISVWYSVSSPLLINYGPTEDARNRLRSFGKSGKYVVKLLDMTGLPYEKNKIFRLMGLYNAFSWMMRQSKESLAHRANFERMMTAQYQNSQTLSDGTVVLLDGPATDRSRPSLPSFKAFDEASEPALGELLALLKLVDPSKPNTSIPISFDIQPIEVPAATTYYSYPENSAQKSPTRICPRTLRPYTTDPKTQKHWSYCARRTYGSRYISNYNYFAKYLMQYEKYPSEEEFIKFIASRQRNKGISTLPAENVAFVRDMMRKYQVLIEEQSLTPKEFSSKIHRSMSRVTRADLDGGTPNLF